MAYLGTQPNDLKNNLGLYTPSEILQLTKDGNWGGSLELIQEQTYSSGVSFVDFTSIQENKYDVHLLTYQDVMPDTNNVKPMQLQFFESGVLDPHPKKEAPLEGEGEGLLEETPDEEEKTQVERKIDAKEDDDKKKSCSCC